MSETNPNALFQIKGIKDGLLVTLGDGDWQLIQAQLFDQIESQSNFFRGAKLTLDVGYHILHAIELSALRDKLADQQVILTGLISFSPTTDATAHLFGLATKLPEIKIERNIHSISTQVSGENAILIQRTMRSGFKVNHEGHVVIIGDINPGAEVISGGSIVVWGRLLGQVSAGAGGDELAMVCALDFSPSLLRINEITFSNTNKKKRGKPQLAMLINNEIILKDWDIKEKK